MHLRDNREPMDIDFRRASLTDLAAQVRTAELSARELVAMSLARIEELDSEIRAFVAVDADRALASAAAIDSAVAGGGDPGPLAGIPIAVKDLEDAEGFPTTYGSALFAGAKAAERDSVQVERLRAAGCVVVGKTNTPEFGFKADTVNSTFGATANPWSLEHTPGGSSGGSAAAIAAGMVPLATGSDGGGSIRIPSSCCGLTGIKTSLGRVPTGGEKPPDWRDLSTRGPMAMRVADVVTALEVVVGPDPTDLRSLPKPEASWTAALNDPRLPARIAWSPTLGYAPVDDEVLAICQSAVEKLERTGTEVIQVDSVFDTDPISDWLTMAMSYSARTLAQHRDDESWSLVDPMLVAQTKWATEKVGIIDLIRAEDSCHLLNRRLVELFRDVRLLVTPTVAAPPPPRSLEGSGLINGTIDANWARFTYPFNVTRSPAASVCVGLTKDRLPVGLQLVGPQHADLVVIRSAAAAELAVGFDELAPL
ncbi:MAG TPA: amidase [Acidimicrobiales bacterium]|nr:amidase [Acidimicrobiales bacterium]